MFEISYTKMFLRESLSSRDTHWNILDEYDVRESFSVTYDFKLAAEWKMDAGSPKWTNGNQFGRY